MSEQGKYAIGELQEQLSQRITEVAALEQELADLRETEPGMWDQATTDQIVFYRNLAIKLGARPGSMDNEWDAGLSEHQQQLEEQLARPPVCWCGKPLEPAHGQPGHWNACETCTKLAVEGAAEAMQEENERLQAEMFEADQIAENGK